MILGVTTPLTLNRGRYQLVEKLGMGGTATVWLAQDHHLEVTRVVKLLNPNFSADSSVRRRFEREARTMARLVHPHVVVVHDFGVDDEHAWIVMEHLCGGSLADRVAWHGPLAPRLATHATIGLLEGLQAAHDNGVVHRDVKPHNVLLTAPGVVKVSDFGIASLVDQRLTRTGMVMGTLGYMPPEQRRSAARADARADIYAAGATLFYLLTGAEPLDIWSGARTQPQLATLPSLLCEVIERATAYEPEARYERCEGMLADLRLAMGELPPDPRGSLALVVKQRPKPSEPGALTWDASADAAYQGDQVRPGHQSGYEQAPTVYSHEEALPSSPTMAWEPDFTGETPALDTASGPMSTARSGALGWMIGAVGVTVAAVAWLARPAPNPDPVITATMPASSVVQTRAVGAESTPAEDAPIDLTEPATEEPLHTTVSAGTAPVLEATPRSLPQATTKVEQPGASPGPAPTAGPTVDPAPTAVVEPTAAAPPVAPGRLYLNTVPWSEVYVDGAHRGQTGWNAELPAGEHTVTLRRPDGAEKTTQLTVTSGDDTRFCWNFHEESTCS